MSDQLKLLAAKIREGSSQVKLCRGEWMKRGTKHTYACTLTTAAIACNPELVNQETVSRDYVLSILRKCTGVNFEFSIWDPELECYRDIDSFVIQATDYYKWSRIRIASYLEHYEEKNP